MVVFIERELFLEVKDKDITTHFENIKGQKVVNLKFNDKDMISHFQNIKGQNLESCPLNYKIYYHFAIFYPLYITINYIDILHHGQ